MLKKGDLYYPAKEFKNMSKKTKILIGILAVGIVLAGGWWVWNNYYKCSSTHPEFCNKSCKTDNDCYPTWCCECINTEEKCLGRCKWEKAVLPYYPCKCIQNTCTKTELKQVTITTDKTEYEQGETVKITIQNKQDTDIDICCLGFCAAVDSFPTRIEKYENSEWKFSDVGYYCPILEILVEEDYPGVGVSENDFVCYKLSAKSSFELEIHDFYEDQTFDKNEKVRIVYYFGKEKTPIYSNEFTIKEK